MIIKILRSKQSVCIDCGMACCCAGWLTGRARDNRHNEPEVPLVPVPIYGGNWGKPTYSFEGFMRFGQDPRGSWDSLERLKETAKHI